jgi:hypothetical protein
LLGSSHSLIGNVTTTEGGTNGKNPTIEPPPIRVGNVQNYQEMYSHSNFQTLPLNSGDIKIKA